MAFDGGFLHKVVDELNIAADSHIYKIYQPSKDELVFLLRKKGLNKKLLITVRQGASRIHFTENKYENPEVPPNFCMLLRKYLLSARLLSVTQPSLERIAELNFSATNELGDIVNLKLVCEFIGNMANVILLGPDGKILDALRHSDVETAKRLILPGALYEYPAAEEKLNPVLSSGEEIYSALSESECPLCKKLLSTVEGFSPLVCREIEYLTDLSNNDKKQAFLLAFDKIKEDLTVNQKPVMLYDRDGLPLDFCYIEICQYGKGFNLKYFDDFSSLLDAFYSAKDLQNRISTAARDIIKLVNNLKNRTEKKLSLRLIELKNCENRDSLRIYGELLKSNLHLLKNGDTKAVVPNYYDENLSLIEIPLNPTLSPSKNADKYFKDYKKTYSAEQALTVLTEKDKEELVYFDSVLDSISRSTTLAEISEIRTELSDSGYIKRQAVQKKKKPPTANFKEYTSQEGYKILVGKNNIQNDLLTCRMASKNDLWFHVKNIPGSHVVVFCGGENVSDETVLFAASLAALHSKAATSSGVPVDYTQIKYVKKPAGAKPGMVIYTTNKTVYVTPPKEEF